MVQKARFCVTAEPQFCHTCTAASASASIALVTLASLISGPTQAVRSGGYYHR